MMADVPESAASESDDPRLELAEDNSSDSDLSQQSLPSHNPPVTDDTDDTDSFSFNKFIQVNPHLSWEAPSKDEPHKEVQVEVSEESEFSFGNFAQTHPGLSFAFEEEEPVAAAMSRWNTPSLSQSDESSSYDSMTWDLLEPPPSLRALELSYLKTQSTTFDSSPSEDGSSSPDSCGKRRRTESDSSSDGSSSPDSYGERSPESVSSSDFDTSFGDLKAQSILFLARHAAPPIMQKPPIVHPFTTAIDPSFIGLEAMDSVLRDLAMMTKELEEDERKMGLQRKQCACDVSMHPPWWSDRRIQDVHNYSFLLDCQDLELDSNLEVAATRSETIKVYKIPMSHNNPLKLKVEQVLKFVDVEIGFGDQTRENVLHYVQPYDRMVLLVVSRKRVVGVLVAEELPFAHRIRQETTSYMDLEEDPTPVKVGINRLWVHISMRRKHLATVLCKLLGIVFYKNETLKKEDYAFNNISDSMVMFAKVFLQTSKPPLYLQLR